MSRPSSTGQVLPKAGRPPATRHYGCTSRAPVGQSCVLCSRPFARAAQGPVRQPEARECPTRRSDRTPASSPSSCRSRCRRSPSSPSGRPRRGCGATPSTRCARTSRAFRRRWPTRSSPATAGPGDVVLDPFSGRGTAPLQAAAEGRIGVGNDLNPFAHLLTAAKVEPPTAAEARTRPAALSPRLGRRGGDTGWTSPTRPRPLRAPLGFVPAAGSGDGPEPGRRRSRPRSRSRSTRGRSPRCCSCVAPPARRPHGSLPRRRPRGDPPRQDALVPLDPHAQHVQHGAALRPRLRGQDRLRAAGSGRLRPPRRQARPPVPRPAAARAGIALLGDARDGRPRARAALRARGLPDRARLVLTSPPYLRVVKYGYYNWLRTWFLGYDAKAIDATLDDAHHRAPYLEFLRDVLRDLRPALTDDGIAVLVIGDVVNDRGKPSDGHDLAERVWE